MSVSPAAGASSMRRNALANMTGRVASALVWVAMTPFVLGRFGQERFGVWSLLFLLSGYVAALDLGMASGLSRFVAVGVTRRSRRAVREVVLRSLAVSVVLALVAAGATVLLRGALVGAFHVPDALGPEVRLSLLVFASSLLAFSVTQVLQAVLAGFQRLDLQNACFLAGLLLHTVLLVFVLRSGGGLVGAVAAMLAGNLLAGGLALLALGRCMRTLPENPGAMTCSWGELLRFGLTVQATNAFAVGQLQTGKLLVGLLGRLTWVTQLELGFRVANALWSVPMLVLGAVIPAAASASESGGREAVRGVYEWAGRWVLTLAGILLAGLWLTAAPLMTLWLGSSYPEATAAARGLAIAFALATISAPASAVGRGGGWPWLESWAGGAGLALNIGFTLALVPWMGAMGAVWGMALSYALAGSWLVGMLHRRLGIPTGRWLLHTVAPRVLLPGAAAALLSLVVCTRLPQSRPEALSELALGGLCFAVVAALLSWFTGDARAVWDALARRGKRGIPVQGAE